MMIVRRMPWFEVWDESRRRSRPLVWLSISQEDDSRVSWFQNILCWSSFLISEHSLFSRRLLFVVFCCTRIYSRHSRGDIEDVKIFHPNAGHPFVLLVVVIVISIMSLVSYLPFLFLSCFVCTDWGVFDVVHVIWFEWLLAKQSSFIGSSSVMWWWWRRRCLFFVTKDSHNIRRPTKVYDDDDQTVINREGDWTKMVCQEDWRKNWVSTNGCQDALFMLWCERQRLLMWWCHSSWLTTTNWYARWYNLRTFRVKTRVSTVLIVVVCLIAHGELIKLLL